MQGYFSLLEQESVSTGSDAEAFHATVHNGSGSVWQHWREHFAEPYASTPGLEPLPAVYARPVSSSAAVARRGIDEAQRPGSDATPQRNTPCMKGKPSLNVQGVARAVGLRKSSIADVRVARGEGRIYVNDQPYDEALRDLSVRVHAVQPFLVTGTMGQYDVVAQVRGGGPSSTAQALQHGIAKALTLLVGQEKVGLLDGMMRWDPRKVERKKPGRKKARKGFAYVRR